MPCTTHSVTTGLTTRVPFVAVRRPSSLSGGLALAHETSTRAVSWETPYLIASSPAWHEPRPIRTPVKAITAGELDTLLDVPHQKLMVEEYNI